MMLHRHFDSHTRTRHASTHGNSTQLAMLTCHMGGNLQQAAETPSNKGVRI